MVRRQMRFFWFICFTVLLLSQYQNCAPAQQNIENPGAYHEALPVDTLDPEPDFKVKLPEDHVFSEDDVIAGEGKIVMKGFCDWDQDGSRLGWELDGLKSGPIASGSANCEKGQFVITLQADAVLSCEEPFQLRAFLGAGSSDEMEFSIHCPTVASR